MNVINYLTLLYDPLIMINNETVRCLFSDRFYLKRQGRKSSPEPDFYQNNLKPKLLVYW